jgi:hypothetical protein
MTPYWKSRLEAPILVLGIVLVILASAPAAEPGKPLLEDYLRSAAVPRAVIDRFLAGPRRARFDPELGYVLGDYLPQDGMDKSATISTVQTNGARTSFLYAGKKCRINTAGDSFTQCHQVSDGETWQEYLAGQLGEPVLNFRICLDTGGIIILWV